MTANSKDKKIVREIITKEISKKPIKTKKDVETVAERVVKRVQRNSALRKRLGRGLKFFVASLILLYIGSRLVRKRPYVRKYKSYTGLPRYTGRNSSDGVPPNIGGQNVMAFAAMKRQELSPTTIRQYLNERRAGATLRPSPTMRPRTLSGKKKVADMSNLPKNFLNRLLHFKPNNKPNNW